jgi:hypothetical protein
MEIKTYIVAFKSECVKEVKISINELEMISLENMTTILSTTFSPSNHEAIKKIASEHKMPVELLVAFELAV